MIIHLNETTIRTSAQVRAVLKGTLELEFTVGLDAPTRCSWVASVLVCFGYHE